MKDALVLFEDEAVRRLFPLALTRPVFDLRCGAYSLAEKTIRHFPGLPIGWQCRDYVQRVIAEESAPRTPRPEGSDRVLLVNGRVLMDDALAASIRRAEGEIVFRHRSASRDVVAACVGRSRFMRIAAQFDVPLSAELFEGIGETAVDARMVHYPWDLIALNANEIERDLAAGTGDPRGGTGSAPDGAEVSPAAHIERRDRVYLDRARVDAGAMLDARGGPIWIGDGAHIGANAVIEGPAVIGARTLVRPGAFLTGGVTVGPKCKIGGEVATSIIQGFANKQHEGYLGNSYVGAWVNLGAGTHTSDLKNNYAPVRVVMNGESVDTGLLHVGLIIGDHAKSAIGTLFNTGSLVGVAANVFASGLGAKAIPSFTWYGPSGMEEHDLERALITVRRVMERRDQDTTVAYEAMLRTVYDLTIEERAAAV